MSNKGKLADEADILEHPKAVTPKSRRDPGFGERIRQLRLARGLTLQQLSQRCGLAASTLSKIEQNKISSSYENILGLADGLDLDVAELFNAEAPRMASGRRSITRAGQGARLQIAQYEYEMLCTDLSRKQFAPIVTTLRAHSVADFPELVRHEGEEFIYILSGTVELVTEHYEKLALEVGDSCYFDSQMGHACISAGKADAVILWVCSRFSLSIAGGVEPDHPDRLLAAVKELPSFAQKYVGKTKKVSVRKEKLFP